MIASHAQRTWGWHLVRGANWVALLTSAVVLLRFATLGTYPLSDNTESRYADMALRMANTGDWVTLRLADGVAFWGKPPLSTWMSALGIRLLGANEWGVRIPMLLAALLTSLLTWHWARRNGRRAGILSLAVLWGGAGFFVSAGAAMTDGMLVLSVTLALAGFRCALVSGRRVASPLLVLVAGASMGLLAKGPVAVVLIVASIAAYALSCSAAWRSVRRLPWLWVVAATALLAAPWYLLAEARTPGFLRYFLVGEHWDRFMTPGWAGDLYGRAHERPRGLIWPLMALGLLPWAVLAPILALGRRRAPKAGAASREPDCVLLWSWALAPAILFSFSGNILWTYALPAAPAFAILLARWLSDDRRRWVVDLAVIAGLAFTVLAYAVALKWQADRGGVRSVREVLAAAEAAGHAPGEIAFLGVPSYSASFYSGGTSPMTVPEADLTTWLDSLPRSMAQHDHWLLVAYTRDWDRLASRFTGALEPIASGGDYVLLTVRGEAGSLR